MNKSTILHALETYARQRPGLEFGNYGDISSYRSESRQITNDLHDVLELISSISWRDSITADDLINASKHAYSGRLSLETNGNDLSIEYCAGQYFPTEYRKAICAVLASALWDYWRTNSTTGDDIRKTAKSELSRRVASRYFN